MPSDVYANGREVIGKASSGTVICALPDVCFTPPENPATPPGVPIPYPNTAKASDTDSGSKSVMISGEPVSLSNQSEMKTSYGDEAGCAAKKGIVTTTNRGKVVFESHATNVKIEGECVNRHFDITTNNHA